MNETSPAIVPNLIIDDEQAGISSPLVVQIRNSIEGENPTCDTVLIKNEHDDDLLTDENDVTYQDTSSHGDLSSHCTPIMIRLNNIQRNRSNSEGHVLKYSTFNCLADRQSLR